MDSRFPAPPTRILRRVFPKPDVCMQHPFRREASVVTRGSLFICCCSCVRPPGKVISYWHIDGDFDVIYEQRGQKRSTTLTLPLMRLRALYVPEAEAAYYAADHIQIDTHTTHAVLLFAQQQQQQQHQLLYSTGRRARLPKSTIPFEIKRPARVVADVAVF